MDMLAHHHRLVRRGFNHLNTNTHAVGGAAQDEAHLVGQGISGCQLSLVVQHLLKVRNVPPGISGVAVKALQEMVVRENTVSTTSSGCVLQNAQLHKVVSQWHTSGILCTDRSANLPPPSWAFNSARTVCGL